MHKKKACFFWGQRREYIVTWKKARKKVFFYTLLFLFPQVWSTHWPQKSKTTALPKRKWWFYLPPSCAQHHPQESCKKYSVKVFTFSWGKGSKVFCFGENGDTWMQFGMKPFTHVSRTYLRILLTGSNLYKVYPIRGILGGRRDLTKTATTDTKEPVVTTKYLEQSLV